MVEFNEYEVLNKEEANEEIAKRIQWMQQYYQEIVLIANRFNMRIDFALESPDNVRMGHNQEPYVRWNSSSSYC